MIKKLTVAVIIAVVVAASLSIAGCTINLNPPPSNTASPSPSSSPSPSPKPSSAAGSNTTVAMAGFKVTFPSKYKYSQNGNTQMKLYIYLDPANKVTGVNVGTEPSQGLPLDSWSTRYTNNLLDYQSVSYRQGLSNTTLGGQSAQTLTFQATVPVQYNKDQTIDQTIIVQEAWTVNNGTVFTVTYKAPPNDFSKFAPEAQKIVKSLRLT